MMSVGPSASAIVAFLVLLVGAPLVPGVISRTKSIATGRRGAPVWQLYADLLKMARRGAVYSTTASWMFRLAPPLLVATALAAATLVPLDGHTSLVGFSGDAVAFAYLLGLGRFSLVLAALDTGSSFEGMGASREVTFASLVEPGLFVSLAALGVAARDFSLGPMVGAGPAVTSASITPAAVMTALSVFALALADCSRVPVDDPTTHLELTMIHEVMVLDHSGPDLALVMYANALKLGLFASIVGNVLLLGAHAPGWWGVPVLAASLVLFGVAVGVVESVMARLRLPKVSLYIAGASSLALFGLILILQRAS
ncbi:MAG TPA: NADH-quinone oxidoreductase subunit H [Gemmatimonadaceae bacterium]|nr:NADH-quinone oxidoreductase subunit H [Gemmatimonadaceae bacterium]